MISSHHSLFSFFSCVFLSYPSPSLTQLPVFPSPLTPALLSPLPTYTCLSPTTHSWRPLFPSLTTIAGGHLGSVSVMKALEVIQPQDGNVLVRCSPLWMGSREELLLLVVVVEVVMVALAELKWLKADTAYTESASSSSRREVCCMYL